MEHKLTIEVIIRCEPSTENLPISNLQGLTNILQQGLGPTVRPANVPPIDPRIINSLADQLPHALKAIEELEKAKKGNGQPPKTTGQPPRQ